MYELRPTDRVGLIRVGGLGYLAIPFASKMGCEVVVFSGTESKKEESINLGVMKFYATKGLKELKISKPINHLLVTISTQPDWTIPEHPSPWCYNLPTQRGRRSS
jgi:D-arabinose 1-dehydrogenase-like Zn-dependent alcohol dehydrogenase